MSTEQTPQNEEPSYEHKKWVHEIQREDAQRAHDNNRAFSEQVNDVAMKNADAALRAAVLINGGAAVSVLAFIGGLVSQDKITLDKLGDISSSLMLFAFGVASAVAGMGLSYFTNYLTASHTTSFEYTWEHPYVRPGKRTKYIAASKRFFHFLAIGVSLASLVLFVVGMFDVRDSIVRLGTPKPSETQSR